MTETQDRTLEEQRFRAIFDQVLVGIAQVDLSGRFILVNQRFCEMVGRSSEELMRLRMQDITHPEDLGENLVLLQRALTGGPAFVIEKRYVRPDGSCVWVNNSVSVLTDPKGIPQHIVAVSQDITERKHAETRMRFLSDASRVLADWPEDVERALQEIARLAVKDMATLCIADLVQQDGSLRRVAAAHRDSSTQPLLQQVMKYPLAPGSPFYMPLETGEERLDTTITPELQQQLARNPEHLAAIRALNSHSSMVVPLKARDRVLGLLLLATSEPGQRYSESDLSMARELAHRTVATLENARLFRQVQQAVHLRDEFLSVASHELKTPLVSLNLQLELIHRGLSEQSRQNVMGRLGVVRRQLRRLASLVEHLLDVSILASGRLELELSEVDLVQLVRDVLDQLREVFSQTGSQVTLHAPSEPLVGHWDASRLEQVLLNLLGNAARYGQGRPITVRLLADNAQAFLSIQDEGIGIAPEDLERIFDRFERAVSRRHYGGLGLGLYITRRIVEALDGQVRVESEPGRGSTFEVRLPRTAPRPQKPG